MKVVKILLLLSGLYFFIGNTLQAQTLTIRTKKVDGSGGEIKKSCYDIETSIFIEIDPIDEIYVQTEFEAYADDSQQALNVVEVAGPNVEFPQIDHNTKVFEIFFPQAIIDYQSSNSDQQLDLHLKVTMTPFGKGGTMFKKIIYHTEYLKYCDITPNPIFTNREQSKEPNLDLDLYPNPTKNRLKLEYSLDKTSDISVEVLDINGRKIKSFIAKEKKEPGDYSEEFNTESWPEGWYFIRIKHNDNVTSHKILKQ